jgi:hypothetical protein
MAEDVKIKTPIEIKDTSKERVAFDLMEKIEYYDARSKGNKEDRKYWLTLYFQCLKATSGNSLESILKEE